MRYATGALALLLGISGCSWFGDGPVDPPAALEAFTPQSTVRELWSLDVGKGPGDAYLRLQPAMLDKVLYLTDLRGNVQALSVENGAEQWRVSLHQEVTAGVGVGSDLVVVASRKGKVMALARQSGEERWRAQVPSEVLAAPAVGSGIVVVQTVDGRLSAFDAATGKRLWMVERTEPALSLRGTATPVIVSDVVFSGLASGRLLAVSVKDGRVLWEIPVSQPQGRSEIERLIDVDTPVLLVGRVLVAAAYQGKIVAISLDNGHLLWSRELSVFEPAASDGRNLYVSDSRGHITALDLRTGATVWTQEHLHGRRPAGPSVLDHALVVGDFEGYVHFLSLDDGRFVARDRISHSAILTSPLVQGDVAFVSAQDGNLEALRLEPHSR